jgi:hypothetical protein
MKKRDSLEEPQTSEDQHQHQHQQIGSHQERRMSSRMKQL